VYNTAQRVVEDPSTLFPREASMVKLKATELAKHASLEGMQMMGGYGYATEYGVEELVRSTHWSARLWAVPVRFSATSSPRPTGCSRRWTAAAGEQLTTVLATAFGDPDSMHAGRRSPSGG
jgi:hypothetical protein